jgi:hypothetical protein
MVGNTVKHSSEHETVSEARSEATKVDNSFVFGSWSVSLDEKWHFRHTETGRFDIDEVSLNEGL